MDATAHHVAARYSYAKKTLRNRSASSQPEIMKLWNQEVERIIAMRPVSGKDGNLEWGNRENIREREQTL